MTVTQTDLSWEKVKLNTITLAPNCLLNLLKPWLKQPITIIGSGRNETDCTVKFLYYYRISSSKNFLLTHLRTSRYTVIYAPTLVQYIDLNLWKETAIILSPELADVVEMKQPVKEEINLGGDDELLADIADMENDESVENEEDKKDQ